MKTIKISSDNKNLNTIEDDYVFYCPFTGVNILDPEKAENLFLDKIANKNMMAYILEEEAETPIYANELIAEAELIDEPLLESNELEAAAATRVSILTHRKASESAESFRNVGYSILEKLGLE